MLAKFSDFRVPLLNIIEGVLRLCGDANNEDVGANIKILPLILVILRATGIMKLKIDHLIAKQYNTPKWF